jgi:hypothetical protein
VIVKQKIYKRSSNYYCVIYTDASSTIGFCAVLSDPQGERKSFSGWWSLEERVQWHITLKELVAVRRGIAMFQDDLRGRVMRLWEDNQAVVHHLQQNLAVARSHERAAIIGGTPRGPQHHLVAQVHPERAEPYRRVFTSYKPRCLESSALGATYDAPQGHFSCRRPRDVGRIRLSPIMCMSAL